MSRWFRHYAGMMRDEKLVRVAIRSHQPIERVVWVWGAILESAAEVNEGGRYDFDIDEAAYFLRADDGAIQSIVEGLEGAGRLDGGRVAKWKDRQYESDVSTDRVAKYRNRRRAAGLPAMSDYSQFRPELIKRDGESCVYCAATGGLVVDHMVPIALGGTDDRDNLALACKSCNSGKSGRTPEMAKMTVISPSAAEALARYRDGNKCNGDRNAPETETETETEIVGGGGAPAPLVSREAINLANEVAIVCGHDPEFVPPEWMGAAWTTQKWINGGWGAAVILAACKEAMAKKRDGPPSRIEYFEKPIAKFIARQSAPLPQVEIVKGEKLHVVQGFGQQNQRGSLTDAARRLAASFAEDRPGGSGAAGSNLVRMLPPGRRE